MSAPVRSLTALAVAAVALSGCEGITGADLDGTWFQASIEGAVTSEFEGGGRFVAGTDSRRPAAPPMFILLAPGRGATADQAFELFRPGAEVPGVGRYSLTSPVRGSSEIQATFTRLGRSGETLEMFTAYEGELEITVATPDRLEGSFRMTAYRSGQQVGPGRFASTPRSAESPTVRVAGRFAAERGSSVGIAGVRR